MMQGYPGCCGSMCISAWGEEGAESARGCRPGDESAWGSMLLQVVAMDFGVLQGTAWD